jgi:predicted GNAT family acetyltransferase
MKELQFFKNLGLEIKVIPYPSAEEHDHTIYRVSRAKQSSQINEYGVLVTTVYDHILYIRNLDVPVRHRGKGIARALLRYGLKDQMLQHPELTVSELDDHSERPWDTPDNLYYGFGYRFKPDNLEEKTMDLIEYKRRIK